MASLNLNKLNLKMSKNELQDLEFLASVDRFPIVVQDDEIDDQETDSQNTQAEDIHSEYGSDGMTTEDYVQPYLSTLDLAQENKGVIKGTHSSN